VESLPGGEPLQELALGRSQARHPLGTDLVEYPVELGPVHLVKLFPPDPLPAGQ